MYVQNSSQTFGARHFSLFFISLRPQFLVNRAPSAETLGIAILGQGMCIQLSKQQACIVVKQGFLFLMPSETIFISFLLVVSMTFTENLLKNL